MKLYWLVTLQAGALYGLVPFEGYHEPFFDDGDVPDIYGDSSDIGTSSEEADDPAIVFSQTQLQEAAQKLAETALECAIKGAIADVIQVWRLFDCVRLPVHA